MEEPPAPRGLPTIRIGSSALLSIILIASFGMLAAVFFILEDRLSNLATDKVFEERQVIAEMTARQVDRFLADATASLDEAAASLPDDTSGQNGATGIQLLKDLQGQDRFLFMGIQMLDADGRMLPTNPPDSSLVTARPVEQHHVSYVQQFRRRGISDPYVDPATGRVIAEIVVPLPADDGELAGMLAGIVGLDSDSVVDSLNQAKDLGQTGHSELVDVHGRVLVSTEAGASLRPADHLEFYRRMGLLRMAAVEAVPHQDAGSATGETERHVMAFAPLLEADWGVAVGGDEDETRAPITHLRNQTYALGGLATAVVLIISLVAVRLLAVKPR
jgi:hypothetical protein